MLIRIGYDIVLRLFNASPVIFLLRIHPSCQSTLVVPEDFRLDPNMPADYYRDSFGNHCGRLNASAGTIRFRNHAVVWDSGEAGIYRFRLIYNGVVGILNFHIRFRRYSDGTRYWD